MLCIICRIQTRDLGCGDLGGFTRHLACLDPAPLGQIGILILRADLHGAAINRLFEPLGRTALVALRPLPTMTWAGISRQKTWVTLGMQNILCLAEAASLARTIGERLGLSRAEFDIRQDGSDPDDAQQIAALPARGEGCACPKFS